MRRRSVPWLRLAAMLPSLLLLPACLDAKQEVTVGPDGAGTIRQRFTQDTAKAAELFELGKMLMPAMDSSGTVEMPDPFAEAWWRRLAEGVDGYSLGKVTDATAEGQRTVSTEAKFTALPAAAKAGAFFFSSVALEKEEAGGWRLAFRDSLSSLKDSSGGGGMGLDFGALVASFEPQLSGLSLARVVTLPTKVVETNGKLSEDGKTVTWTVDYAKIVEGKDLELTIRFEGADALKLAAFSHKPDFQALLRRFMEAPPKKAEPAKPPADGGGEPPPKQPPPAPPAK